MSTARVLFSSPDGSAHHPGACVAEVPLPRGWRRVWSGPVLAGDHFLDAVAWQDRRVTNWRAVMLPAGDRVIDARHYALLIRAGAPVDGGCTDCQCRAKVEGCAERCRACRQRAERVEMSTGGAS